MNGVQTLLIDGYISQTFQSQAAERYFLNLLKSTCIPPHVALSFAGREGYFFFVHLVPPQIPTQLPDPPSRLLLDRGIVDKGTVVPQTMWFPRSAADRRLHVEDATLQTPIFFEDKDGGLGLSLGALIDGQCHVLRDADVPAPLGEKTTTHIRIVWPGYQEFKRQVPIRDESSTRSPITMARFVGHIGRTVNKFLRDCELEPGSVDDRRKIWQELWRIGPDGIKCNDIIIIGAVHVSAGSWMPIIQLNRYIF
ncbi:hypothetical protein H4582DRAFT_2082444 [Lactarius indigo]|nr:hypothetical protein H4582DRAFT_2082444 [Lactarius indigo]